VQINGLGYTGSRERRDLKKKRGDFELVAQAALLRRKGYSTEATAWILGIKPRRVEGWMQSKKLPPSISPKRHEYHLRARRPLRFNKNSKHEIGYLLSMLAARRVSVGRNKALGRSRFSISVSSEELAREAMRSVKRAFGASPHISTKPRIKPTQRPQHTIFLGSANLAKFFLIGERRRRLSPLLDHPDARLGFTRGLYDFHREVKIWSAPRDRRVLLMHNTKEVLDEVSKTLSERGIGHERANFYGRKGILIREEHIPKFMSTIGFRDKKQRARLAS
jgi:hypothetical protein